MTTREITDTDGLTWTCAQAYAGLGDSAAAEVAAEHEDGNTVEVVCTPTGAAQTVRLRLEDGWSEALSDDDLAAALAEARAGD